MYHKTPWYQTNPELYEHLKAEIADSYPDLRFLIRKGIAFLVGSFPLLDGATAVDRFQIEVEFPPRYPQGMPVVYEVGGRIPRIIDRHMYETGECCLSLPLQLTDAVPESSDLVSFLNGPVRSFFLGQSYFEQTGKWPFGEWSHGLSALPEYYGPILGTRDPKVIAKFLQVISRREIKGHWLCPCGSGKILRNCHLETVQKLHSSYQYAVQQTKWHKAGYHKHDNQRHR